MSKNKISAYASGELSELSFAVKDNIDMANEITGYGSPAWAKSHFKPVANAICLDQLLAAGAACIGKTKLDELAYSLIGMNPFYGAPLNSKVPDRVSGGSSSGSASAVASQLVDFAIGTDTAGSIRVPASNCGIWGYRPSHGVISSAGILALAPSFDTVGIFSKSGEILEKVMQVLLAEKIERNAHFPSVCFVDDVFQIADKKILACMEPMLNKISQVYKVQSVTLTAITNKHINCGSLFELSAHLLSTEVYNTFGAWIENDKPQLSDGFSYGFSN
jgi:amidase